jgi:pimeloyl-ACP methyl ester carboxylesterase
LANPPATSRNIDPDYPNYEEYARMELRVPVDGGEVWADDSGRPHQGATTLVLLHPGVGDSTIWDPVLPQWMPKHRVVRFDVRGYGRSPAPTATYSTVDDLGSVIDHCGLDRVHLVGTSMGGGTAIAYALAQPERVASLVLICPGIPGYEWPADPDGGEFEAVLTARDFDGLYAIAKRTWAAAGDDPAVERLLRRAVRAWSYESEYEAPDPDVFSRLGEVAVPTVLLIGDLDRPALVESNEEAARRIPGCRLVWLPGVDHFPTIRVPDVIAATVLEHCH